MADEERDSKDHKPRFALNVTAGDVAKAVEHATFPARADDKKLPWVPMGPRNVVGRVRALAIDPNNPSTLYAGTAFGGVWKTTDEGETWAPLDNFRPPDEPNEVRQALPIGAIAVAGDSKTVYVGTGEPESFSGRGFFGSKDAGGTLRRIEGPDRAVFAEHFERIVVDPENPDRCWMATDTGLWRLEPGKGLIKDPVIPEAQQEDVTDIAIHFRDPVSPQPPEKARLTVYVGIRGEGIYRRTFDRAGPGYVEEAWKRLSKGLPTGGFARIKLALCRDWSEPVYAMFALPQPRNPDDHRASRVYVSNDAGESWHRADAWGRGSEDQADYNLVLEVHPVNPLIVFAGAVNLHRSLNQGASWAKVIDQARFNAGDRAQHADQHAIVFDPADPNRVWAANDGGVVLSTDLGGSWRRRGHGISAAQLYDVTVHPKHPFIQGGGLQDNGTWVSFGGPTWLYVDGGDGGAMAFEPQDPTRLLVTWQGDPALDPRVGVDRVTLQPAKAVESAFDTHLPDLLPASPGARAILRAELELLVEGFRPADTALFTGVLAHHPSKDNHFLVGRKNAAYLTTDGFKFTRLTAPIEKKAGKKTDDEIEVSAVAYAIADPDTTWWLGTSEGEVLVTRDAGGGWDRKKLSATGARVTSIAVHPGNDSIVAGACEEQGGIYLTGDGGQHWWNISGDSGDDDSPTGLGPSPIYCVAFDPGSSSNAGDDQTLYVGTLAGVYVIRNARAATAPAPPPGAPSPKWRTFNTRLPLVLVNDLATVQWQNAGGASHAVLRCATYGRGVFECDLGGTPKVRLFIRSTPIDDGRRPPAALADDPRYRKTPLDPLRAFDIRSRFSPIPLLPFGGSRVDGVEFDEELTPEAPEPGAPNLVYVQVHNGGAETAAGVEVRLFVAEALGNPPVVPNLPADLPPLGPLAVSSWTRLGAKTLTVAPGQPVVAAFDWTPPASARGALVLLALCAHPDDPLPPGLPVKVSDLVTQERRAAVRITPLPPSVYIRDGLDDNGKLGSVRWGGRSPDIIVVQGPVANAAELFANLGLFPFGNHVRYDRDNHIFIRVHNRRLVEVDAEVALFRAPADTAHQHATWTSIGQKSVEKVPAKSWKLAPEIVWNPGPAPPAQGKPEPCFLVAVARTKGDPEPDFSHLTTLDDFWRILSRDPADRIALRALRFKR